MVSAHAWPSYLFLTQVKNTCQTTRVNNKITAPPLKWTDVCNVLSVQRVRYCFAPGRLGYPRLCSSWVPVVMSDLHKTKRLGSALQWHSDKGDVDWWPFTRSGCIVSWNQSLGLEVYKIFENTHRKLMSTVFWYRKGYCWLIFFINRWNNILWTVLWDSQ